ncbi:hypothetical protein C0995_014350, partial [Termitomyces sp. Mi166
FMPQTSKPKFTKMPLAHSVPHLTKFRLKREYLFEISKEKRICYKSMHAMQVKEKGCSV